MRLFAENALLAVGIAVVLAIYAVVGPVAGTAATAAAAVAVIITMVWPELEVSHRESSVISHRPVPPPSPPSPPGHRPR